MLKSLRGLVTENVYILVDWWAVLTIFTLFHASCQRFTSLATVFQADIYTYIQLENNVSQFLAIRIFYVTTYSFLRKMYEETTSWRCGRFYSPLRFFKSFDFLNLATADIPETYFKCSTLHLWSFSFLINKVVKLLTCFTLSTLSSWCAEHSYNSWHLRRWLKFAFGLPLLIQWAVSLLLLEMLGVWLFDAKRFVNFQWACSALKPSSGAKFENYVTWFNRRIACATQYLQKVSRNISNFHENDKGRIRELSNWITVRRRLTWNRMENS